MDEMILLVEDEFNIRQNIKALLELEEFTITDVKNGEEAVSALEKKHFDLIITDVMMTKMNGVELLKHIRSNSKTQAVPVILITAKPKKEIQNYLEPNKTYYLAKPFNFESLIASVQKALQ